MSEIRVGDEIHEKWHMKPLEVEEGDRVRFTFTPPKHDGIREKVGTVKSTHKDTVARIDVDGAGTWVLKHGAVEISQEGRSDRYNGSLLEFEKIPRVGMKAIAEREVEKEGAWDKPIVGEVTEVNLENDKVRFQREFDPTNLPVRFSELTEVK